ncbi:carbonate dehydratase [Aurantivibrio plasticivorans]
MPDIKELFENNVKWASDVSAEDANFFSTLAQQQSPDYLWIGCSDSRVPANEIVGLLPGELFVHRNIANVVSHTDLNCLSVMNYAIDVLKVKHVIVCGHYGCGGVRAALEHNQVGIVDHWLRNIRDVYFNNREQFKEDLKHMEIVDTDSVDQLCELNVKQQVYNVAHSNVVQNAWLRGQPLTIHGWIYGLEDGLLKKLSTPINSMDQIAEQYRVNPRK